MPHSSRARPRASLAYTPVGGASLLSARQPPARVAIDAATHNRLRVLAQRRYGRRGSASRLGCVVLDEYLAEIERAYFGAARVTACAPVPAANRPVDAVVFDMDGVLCDSEHLSRAAGAQVLREMHGVSPDPNDFAPFTGTGEANFLAGVAGVYGVQSFDAEKAKRRFFDVYIHGGFVLDLRPFPGVPGLVRRLKSLGLKVAVASAADRVKIDANLRAIGLDEDVFDFVTSSDDIVNKKPAPDVFLAAAAGLSVAPTRCVVVEDAVAGVQAAVAAGMRCVGVATSMPANALLAAGADVVREEPAFLEIRDLLGEELLVPEGTGVVGVDAMEEAE